MRALPWVGWVLALGVALGSVVLLGVGIPEEWRRWVMFAAAGAAGGWIAISALFIRRLGLREGIQALTRLPPGAVVFAAKPTSNVPLALARLAGTQPVPVRELPSTLFVLADSTGLSLWQRGASTPWRQFEWASVRRVSVTTDTRSDGVARGIGIRIAGTKDVVATIDLIVQGTQSGWFYVRDHASLEELVDRIESVRPSAEPTAPTSCLQLRDE